MHSQSCPTSTRLLCLLDFTSKNTGVGSHFLLQGIFLIQGSNPSLLHWQVDFRLLGKPRMLDTLQQFNK